MGTYASYIYGSFLISAGRRSIYPFIISESSKYRDLLTIIKKFLTIIIKDYNRKTVADYYNYNRDPYERRG